jgi:ribosome-binding factor A
MTRSTQRNKPPSQRQLRVGEELRHVLARIFARQVLREPALQDTPITVTEVRASPDLRHATVFVMPLAGRNEGEVLAALRRGAAFLRRELSRDVPLRVMPSLAFELDRSFDEASHIDALLRRPEVERDLAAPDDTSPDDQPAGDGPENGPDNGPANGT